MPVLAPPRLALAGLLLALALPAAAGLPGAPPAPAPVTAPAVQYSDAELRLIYDEALATGGATYKFYIVGSDDRDVLQDAWQQIESGRDKGLRLKTLVRTELRQQQAFALPIPIRDQLRRLVSGEHSAVFPLDKRNWALVELESVDSATPMPVFEALRNALPKLVTTGAIPEPRELAGNPFLQQRSLMNKANTTAEFDRLPPGFDIDMPLSGGMTLLQRSLARDDAAMVKAVLTRAANTNLCLLRQCPLMLAVRGKGNAAAYVAALLAAGARPDQVSAPGENTALTVAANNGDLASVQRLLAAGASPEGADGPETPFTLAAYHGHREVVQQLLAKGADPLARRPGGNGGFVTAVAAAQAGQKPEVLALLRAAARKQVGAARGGRWNWWIEQDGEPVKPVGGRHHLKRKPFSLFVQLPAGSELRVEASTSPHLFDEYKAADITAPLFRTARRIGELHDGSVRTLLVSDFAARTAAPDQHGGVHGWAWSEGRRDFARQEKTEQGTALVREIAALVVDDSLGRTELPIERTKVREISVLAGIGFDYTPALGDLASPRRLRLVFDR